MHENRSVAVTGDVLTLRERLERAVGASYVLGPELGRGGMGIVFRATDLKLRREVAIKVLAPELAWREDLRHRLVREAQLAAGLSHPNVVPIYDVGETEELVWLVMAFVDGETLDTQVRREGPQALSTVRSVLQGVAWALAYAHARGIIHRDIKPDNIMIEAATGRPVVTDFGIAKAWRADSGQLTGSGQVLGTPRYMAPEQALGESEPDARSDLYSLGLVGYFVLTGKDAIRGETFAAVLTEHHAGLVADTRALRPQVPERLVRALETALARDPAQRFARAEDFAQAVARAGPDIPETPAVIQQFFRATQRAFSFVSLFGIGLGVVGFTAVPSVLTLLILGSVGATWVRRLEAVIRADFGWDAMRRGIYAERARSLEERSVKGDVLATAPLSSLTWLLTIGGCAFLGALYLPVRPRQSLVVEILNIGVLAVSAFGWIFAARLLGVTGESRFIGPEPYRPSAATAFQMSARVCAVVGVLLGVVWGPWWGGVGGLVATSLCFLWLRYGPRRRRRTRPDEWQLPRILDLLATWVFARLSWSRGGLRVRRDEPTGGRLHRIGALLVRRAQRETDRALTKLPASERWLKIEVVASVHLLGEALARTREALRHVAARLLRLQPGAIDPSDEEALAALYDETERARALELRLREQLREQWDALRAVQSAVSRSDPAGRAAAVAEALNRAKRTVEASEPTLTSPVPPTRLRV